MTDRELLEFAADAIGITLITKTLTNWDDSETEEFFQLFDDAKVGTWNPLNDDGDALRLAAKLHLWEAVRLAHREVSDTVDIYAATRRSIVRAAAEIGKEKK